MKCQSYSAQSCESESHRKANGSENKPNDNEGGESKIKVSFAITRLKIREISANSLRINTSASQVALKLF